MNTISIVVPVFNAANYLHNCIDSILSQDYQDYELILVDDGSIDQSLQICNEYAKNNDNIKVVHIENSGVSIARNTGIKKASGTWITFIDCDDQIEKDYLSSFHLSNNSADLYVQGYKIFEKNNYISERNVPTTQTVDKFDAFIELEIANIINSPVCKLFKSDIIRNNNIIFDSNLSYGEDHIFCLEYLNCCSQISISSHTGYHYIHQNIESLTNKIIPIDNLYYYLKKFTEQSYKFSNKANIKNHTLRVNERSYSTIKRVIINSVQTNNVVYLKHSKRLCRFAGTKYLKLPQIGLILMFKYMPSTLVYFIFRTFNKWIAGK